MKVIHYEKIDSTQKEVWRRLEKEIVISADIQTEGIGTHGRTWYTTQKGNIAFSIGLELNKSVTFKTLSTTASPTSTTKVAVANKETETKEL